jgi:hypothetical protein
MLLAGYRQINKSLRSQPQKAPERGSHKKAQKAHKRRIYIRKNKSRHESLAETTAPFAAATKEQCTARRPVYNGGHKK